MQVGRATTEEAAREWEETKKKAITPSVSRFTEVLNRPVSPALVPRTPFLAFSTRACRQTSISTWSKLSAMEFASLYCIRSSCAPVADAQGYWAKAALYTRA